MLVWMPRPKHQICAAAKQMLREKGTATHNDEYRCPVFKDEALEMRARLWMHCPICGHELEASMLQMMPTTKTKILAQWSCPGCPFQAHGCLMRVGEYVSVSWTGHEK